MSFTFKRLLFHLLLAVFVANAANKFFIGDLEYEEEHQFYERIFNFEGDAPDQYRILPLLAIKGLRAIGRLAVPDFAFHHAVLIFNFICAFLLFELSFRILTHLSRRRRFQVHLLFAILYIYTQYTGWRPDTLGLLLLCQLYVFGVLGMERAGKPNSFLYALFHLFAILLISFSRSDIAAIYALFAACYFLKSNFLRFCIISLPFVVQALLQFYWFADAQYYTKSVMLLDNLKGYYILRNPASWLIAAIVLLYFKSIVELLRNVYARFPVFVGLALLYVLLVFVLGRLNEYRLYLPFLPLIVYISAHWKDLAIPSKR